MNSVVLSLFCLCKIISIFILDKHGVLMYV